LPCITFATLRQFLIGLGFAEKTVPHSHVVFEHEPSGTVLVLPLYRPRDKVWEPNLVAVRKRLVDNGVIAGHAFEDLLHETSV
jgi:hypothetical protein